MTYFHMIYAFIISMILNICFLVKKHIDNNETKLYSNVLILNLVGILFDFLCSFLYYNKYNPIIIKIFMKLYFIYLVSFVYIMSKYCISICNENKQSNKIQSITKILYIIFLVLSLVLNIDITSSNVSGLGLISVYVYSTIMIIIWYILFIKNYKYTNKKKIIPLFLFSFFMLLIAIIQSNNQATISISICELCVLFIMYFTIENPDMKFVEYEKNEKEKLIRMAQSKNEFLSDTSHELRTPLNAIIGLSEDINSYEYVDESIIDDTKDLINASNSLLNIISNILDSSKIENGKLDIINVDYYARKELESIGNIYKVKAFKKNIELDINIRENVPEVLYGDIQRIKQVISNILDNSVKFTDHGKITYDVDFNYNELIINISDTGNGISEEEINLFLSNENELKMENVYGLGLSISKNLIKLLNGKASLKSELNKGTSFYISFPSKLGNEKTIINTSNEIDYLNEDYNGKKILVVDDNPLNIKVFKKAVKSLNLVIDECYNGENAIEKIELNNDYDLIFMDIMMPIMNGIDTMEMLNKMSNFNTPVIALTADANIENLNKYKSLGFTDYLSKPFSKDMVSKKIYQVIKGK